MQLSQRDGQLILCAGSGKGSLPATESSDPLESIQQALNDRAACVCRRSFSLTPCMFILASGPWKRFTRTLHFILRRAKNRRDCFFYAFCYSDYRIAPNPRTYLGSCLSVASHWTTDLFTYLVCGVEGCRVYRSAAP